MIRPARPGDVAAIVGLEEESLGPDAWSWALVEEGVAGRVPTVRHLVAELNGCLAAYAAVSLAGEVAELQRLAVAPAHRRLGLGGALVGAVVALAREAGAHRLLLEVRPDNAGALALYAEHGFGEIGRRRRYYRDGADALVLARSLTGPETKVSATA